ncbi:MAG TPA: hypothetical protein VF789_18155 [Thermoanaerobaculia bacterium]
MPIHPEPSHARKHPNLIAMALNDGRPGRGLVFRPEPPGDQGRLRMPVAGIPIQLAETEWNDLVSGLEAGVLTLEDVRAVLDELRTVYGVVCPPELEERLLASCRLAPPEDAFSDLQVMRNLDATSLVAVRIVDRAQRALLGVEPLQEVRFAFSTEAKIALRLGWEAMAKYGRFPLPPKGPRRLAKLDEKPSGPMHFVSASDGDAGYWYTMGIALSPEAQALGEMDATYGLDGELIVPGQAVSPIPPTLAMATRLFAASIPTSSNISEEVQSIPYSSFAHPEIMDIEPARGWLFHPQEPRGERVEDARQALRAQLASYRDFVARTRPEDREFLPDVGGAIDVSHLVDGDMASFAREVLAPFADADRQVTALYLLLDPDPGNAVADQAHLVMTPRLRAACKAVDAARELGLRFMAVADQNEDEWMPNLLEYFTAPELNYLADYSDSRGVIVCDGRPIDPVYTAATSAQRIQSVFTTLSVDILKMGMWLSLDALAARRVWRELHENPHIPERMFLMPIGIVEPFSGFVDNRDRNRTPRAIIDPFEKIRFMIDEAKALGMPSLLTDTRHKVRWVLLGSVDGDLDPHLREQIGAIPLIGYRKFMEAERMARQAGILLGQAGSIETDQIFWILSDTTLDAAREGRNPATAIWTAETERVLRAGGETLKGDLQSQRRAAVLPYLAVVNRTYESHAKLDGWLRYLELRGRGDESLRRWLLARRDRLAELQGRFLAAQKQTGVAADGAYQEAWDEFRAAFCEYHQKIRQSFKAVRDHVAEEWRLTAAPLAA